LSFAQQVIGAMYDNKTWYQGIIVTEEDMFEILILKKAKNLSYHLEWL
jgi:hypothetical protein